VWVREHGAAIEVRYGAQRIALHAPAPGKHRVVTLHEHHSGIPLGNKLSGKTLIHIVEKAPVVEHRPLAHLPYVKTFEQFDFGFQPSIDERQIRELRTLRFVHEASNVILLGPPNVGKTHLAVALAETAIRAGQPANFMTAHQLVDDLGRAYREGRLDRRLRIYLARNVLIIDEMGYLPLDDLGATIFFQLISARSERGSIVLTSNKSYGDWGSIFGDPIIATAILDRFLHHSTTINIRGESYRLKERRKAGLIPPPAQQQDESPAGDGGRGKRRPL